MQLASPQIAKPKVAPLSARSLPQIGKQQKLFEQCALLLAAPRHTHQLSLLLSPSSLLPSRTCCIRLALYTCACTRAPLEVCSKMVLARWARRGDGAGLGGGRWTSGTS
eukprot:2542023-Rhodomonas_salina.1